MGTLGVAEEYEAFIVDSLTQEPLLSLPWSRVQWGRIRNDISSASVDVSGFDGGIECCGPIGGLAPWDQMLRVERNGGIVWDGPITGWSQSGIGELTVRAHDRFVVTQKRLVANYIYMEDSTPQRIIEALIASGGIGDPDFDGWTLNVRTTTEVEDESMSREYRVERIERLFDCINEICDASTVGYFCCVGDQLYLYEPEVRSFPRTTGASWPESGWMMPLNERTTIGRPSIDVDGLEMATRSYVGVAGQGVSGYPIIGLDTQFEDVYSRTLLEAGSGESRAATQADADLMANRVGAEHAAPALTLERFRLSPDFGGQAFPSDLSQLVPGIRCRIDFEETCAFNVPLVEYYETAGVPFYAATDSISIARLDDLEVQVDKADGGMVEQVLASFRPVTGFIA